MILSNDHKLKIYVIHIFPLDFNNLFLLNYLNNIHQGVVRDIFVEYDIRLIKQTDINDKNCIY